MPSHIHLIARSENTLLTGILRDFKSYISKQIIKLIAEESFESRSEWLLHMFKFHAKYKKSRSRYQFWQNNNHPLDIDSANAFENTISYIHNNPVEASMVNEDYNFIYSSANPFTRVKLEAW